MKHKLTSSLAVPVLLIATGAIGYLTVVKSWNFEISTYAIFLFVLIYILILERRIPLREEWKSSKKAFWTDIKHLIFSAALFDALGKMLALSLVLYVQKTAFTALDYWNGIPFIATYIIANLIGEFLPYWYHRISHIGNPNSFLSLFLWKIHSIHHIPTKMNWFKTNWIHPINIFLNTFLKMAPLLFLGFSDTIIFSVGITHVVIAYLSHANIRTQKSFWDYLIVTPQLHHFHHSIKIEEAQNFGSILPFWDLLFGTYYNREGAVKEVGVVENDETDYPKKSEFMNQLWYPFTVCRDCCH